MGIAHGAIDRFCAWNTLIPICIFSNILYIDSSEDDDNSCICSRLCIANYFSPYSKFNSHFLLQKPKLGPTFASLSDKIKIYDMLEFPFLYIERHRSEKSKHLLFLKLKKLQRTCGCLKRDLYLNPVTLVATQRLIRKQRIFLIDYILSLAWILNHVLIVK